MNRKRHDIHRLLVDLKVYAVEIAATLVFLVWLARAVWNELRF